MLYEIVGRLLLKFQKSAASDFTLISSFWWELLSLTSRFVRCSQVNDVERPNIKRAHDGLTYPEENGGKKVKIGKVNTTRFRPCLLNWIYNIWRRDWNRKSLNTLYTTTSNNNKQRYIQVVKRNYIFTYLPSSRWSATNVMDVEKYLRLYFFTDMIITFATTGLVL